MAYQFKAVTADDLGLLRDLIIGLAQFEQRPEDVTVTEAQLATALDPKHGHCHACLLFSSEQPSEAIGFAFYYFTFATFSGSKGLHIEDFFIASQSRGQGAGKALFHHLRRIALDAGCQNMNWQVLSWNQSAIDFYQSMGGKQHIEHLNFDYGFSDL
mgnify:CR=1 FL=1